MKQGSPLTIALAALFCIATANAYTEEEIAQLCPPPREDISEGSREWQRDSVCRSYLDMGEELGIDSDARQRVIDALTDQRRSQPRGLSTDTAEKTIRAEAERLTGILSRVRAAIGDERMEAFYVYMNNGRERFMLSVLTRALSPEAQLTADQKAQLMVLLSRHAAQSKAHHPPPLWAPENLYDMPEDDVQTIDVVNRVAKWQLIRLRTMELDAQLEAEAEKFLTTKQLETLKRVNQRSHRDSVKHLMREWMTIDSSKLPELQQRVASHPRQQEPIPVSGEIEIEFDIAIDDRKPLRGRRTLANGTALTLESGELRIEVRPTLFKPSLFRSYSRVDVGVFTKVAGEWRRLEQPTSASNPEHAFAMAAGVRKGYFIKSAVKVSD